MILINSSERMDYRMNKITTVPQTKQSNSCLFLLCVKSCGPVSSKAIRKNCHLADKTLRMYLINTQIISTFLHRAVYLFPHCHLGFASLEWYDKR